MELFKLPEHLVQEISKDEEPSPIYRIIPLYKSHKASEFVRTSLLSGVFAEIREYYHLDNHINRKLRVKTEVDVQSISDIVDEGIRNAIAHGCRDKGPNGLVTYGIFYGSEGICHGFRDEGNYFSMPETKRIFENRIPITEFGEEVEAMSGFCIGVDLMYKASDKIFVDIQQNTLFCLQYRNRIVLPQK